MAYILYSVCKLAHLELALGSFQGNREEGKEKEGERGERVRRRRGRHKIEGVTDMLAYIHLRVKTHCIQIWG